ncbi:MAG: FtsX-like permease family protein [Candidatus Marinimicrobia bacterium]|jgi:lipoprotein-releasing system permease protein|nr:FtsX-like permease family protein [Candidatus Neomarinimicrobiota bacterium]MBT3618441.1 FtsX-like permease family protein [Candidatus Neomarinimicrobiota bacterium]MBT3829003.1 FtsX-like permease family protein [Candidatus Neomarinimicrobiota bacterium]MBT3997954.1 FtsX-like permease family protein [Candidatus Neomarinimicrobiota bacterium]MBT4280036.1 FtsX-like permease family protein [Candidatus Neomarinimicrobiota bacterium]
MKLNLKLASRFLLSQRENRPGKLSAWIAVIGLSVGCFSMIVATAVLRGFEEKVTERLASIEGDLRITGFNSEGEISNAFTVLSQQKSVKSFAGFMERKGLITFDGKYHKMVTMKALDMSQLESVYGISISIAEETYGIAVGKHLAQRLNAGIGSELSLLSPVDQPALFGLPLSQKVVISNIFQTDVLDYDDRLVFIPLAVGKKLFTRKQLLDGIDVRLTSGENVKKVQLALTQIFPQSLSVTTWESAHPSLLNAMKLERIGALVVLSLIIIVSGFNLASTLFLIIIRKTKEFGILRAMGLPQANVRSIIFTQGILIGFVGIAAGSTFGLILVWTQQAIGFIPLPSDIYFLDSVPMILLSADVFWIIAISLILILGFIIITSWKANRMPLFESLQYEK